MAAEDDKVAERHVSVAATGSVAAEPEFKALGIAPGDIQTTAVNVQPRCVQGKDGQPPTSSGYRIANQVRGKSNDWVRYSMPP